MTQKILAIGNAIIDITCKVSDTFLKENNLVKGSMSLIGQKEVQALSQLPSEQITSGGSAGNTIATLAGLGSDCSFIGKVADDAFGKKFVSEMSKTGVEVLNTAFSNAYSAQSFILITPDAQRTMCTFLGCAPEIAESDINEDCFKNTSILYLEGYLWDKEETIASLKKAIALAKDNNVKIAFSLSDSFCVSRHKEDFLALVENDLDLLFANEDEALALFSQTSFNMKTLGGFFAKNKKLTAVVTRSEKGCVVFENNKFFQSAGKSVDNLIDTTGAGDSFAAGFLHHFEKDANLKKSAELGNVVASQIVQKIGGRLTQDEINFITLDT